MLLISWERSGAKTRQNDAMHQTINLPGGALAILAQQGALLRRNLRKPIPIESRRIALERMITLQFSHFTGFFAEYSANISMTGMFITTDRIQAPGTRAVFELALTDDGTPICGEAEVVWVRERSQSPDRPAGMGLRFVRLGEEDRCLIRRAVERRLPEGGESADSGAAPAVGDPESRAESGAAAESYPGALRGRTAEAAETRLRSYTGVAVAGSGRGWWHGAAYATLAALLAAALLLLYEDRFQSPGAVGQPLPRPAPPAAVNSAPPVPDSAPAEPVLEMVASWAAAWSAQRTDAYLSFYSQAYRPPDKIGLAEWRELRRDRISRPRRIEVEITDLEVELLDAERARVSFQQDYASDEYRDRVRKVLELVLEDGQWKIQQELVES